MKTILLLLIVTLNAWTQYEGKFELNSYQKKVICTGITEVSVFFAYQPKTKNENYVKAGIMSVIAIGTYFIIKKDAKIEIKNNTLCIPIYKKNKVKRHHKKLRRCYLSKHDSLAKN